MVLIGVLIAAGVALALSHVGRASAAVGTGKPMGPGDICAMRSRRGPFGTADRALLQRGLLMGPY